MKNLIMADTRTMKVKEISMYISFEIYPHNANKIVVSS